MLRALGIFIIIDYLISQTDNSYTSIFTGWASGCRLLNADAYPHPPFCRSLLIL